MPMPAVPVPGCPIIRPNRTRLDTSRPVADVLHWTCSGFSAHSPVLRTLFTLFVLASLSATAALCATVPRSVVVRPHPKSLRTPARPHTAKTRRTKSSASRVHSSAKAPIRATAYRIPSRYRYAGLHHPGAVHADYRPYSRRVHRFRYTPPKPASRRFIAPTEPEPVHEAVSLRRPTFTPMLGPLRGSFESLARQNEITEAEGLERILDENDLVDRIEQHELIPIPASASLMVNDNLVPAHRYCRPWTARFLSDFARAHAAQFGGPLLVSSAVRTVEYQKRLMRINGNAAAAEGDIVSPHLTGATIDIAKGTMSRKEIGWVRSWLLPLQQAGKLDVEEEFQQACFHITVYKTYAPLPAAPGQRRPRRPLPATELASRGR